MYEHIRPLNDKESNHVSVELKGLTQVWQEQKEKLSQTAEYTQFLKRLQREGAIETGIIERLYTWDRGVTEILIRQGIDATTIAHQAGLPVSSAQAATHLVEDQLSALEGLFSFVKGEHHLSEYYIRSLHSELTRRQETVEAVDANGNIIQVQLRRGDYKLFPNNPRRPDGTTYHYCPPEIVRDEMARLVSLYEDYQNQVSPEVLSAWLHHRFTQIHPFQDGNGRVARALASLVFIKEGLFPLVIRDMERELYINALEAADNGNLMELVELFTIRQKAALLKSLGLEQEVTRAQHATAVLDSALEVLRDKTKKVHSERLAVFDKAAWVFEDLQEQVKEFHDRLEASLPGITPDGSTAYSARMDVGAHDSDRCHWFKGQLISLARDFDYFANFERYASWVRLSIQTEQEFELVISIHAYGQGTTGIVVGSAFSALRSRDEFGKSEVLDPAKASLDLFQFNYAEPEQSIRERFQSWLDHVLALGLERWKHIVVGP